MAVTQNTYTGDGNTVLFSFTFPYLETTDIKVSVNGTPTTAYTLANATTVQFNSAPANGDAIRIYRVTDDTDLFATFFPGSAIRSEDLNSNFLQNFYVTQEANRNSQEAEANVNDAIVAAATATSNATTAINLANSAISTANGAVSSANAAVSTANSASSTANSAVSIANSAVSTANSADNKADQAIAAVASALSYFIAANVAAIPGSPSNNDAVEVGDSTGIENFTPLSGIPSGFVGDSGLSVRIIYDSSLSTWQWVQYFPSDPETRYGDAITTLQSNVSSLQTDKLGVTTAASTYLTQASAAATYAPLNSPTFTGTPTVPGYLTSSDAANTYASLSAANTFSQLQTFNGGVADNSGNLRTLPQNPKTASYTLVASDTGKHISITTGGVTVPASVFSTGSIITIFNNSSSSQTITQGASVTLRLAGGTSTGNRTLAAYGVATLLCVASNVFVISGSGLA